MNETRMLYPFGEPVLDVVQTDRTPKKAFVLGKYSSAVHARWLNSKGRQLVTALAVASEPEIFWRGNGVADIIGRIRVPAKAGRLVPPTKDLNGPSAKALDDSILAPLGLERRDVWLCDLVPHSCLNGNQKAAIDRHYIPLAHTLSLPKPSIPELPSPLADRNRFQSILNEMEKSQASVLVTLGEDALCWFAAEVSGCPKKLSAVVSKSGGYGKLLPFEHAGRDMCLLALTHPRQIARLGGYSKAWYEQHKCWLRSRQPDSIKQELT